MSNGPDQALVPHNEPRPPAAKGEGAIEPIAAGGLGPVDELLQSQPARVLEYSRIRRIIGWTMVAALLCLLAFPVSTWWAYQNEFVTSRNASVKGNLSEIGSRLDGVVSAFEVQNGDRFVAGQVLARLQHQHYEAEALQAKALLEGLQQELAVEQAAIVFEERRLESRLQQAAADVAAAEARLNAARSRADDARGFHEARESLLAKGAIPGEVVRDADAKRRTAEALVDAALAEDTAARSAERNTKLDADELDIRRQRIGVLESKVRHARASLAEAETNLDGTLIRAPANGSVVRRIVQLGGSIEVGQPMMLLRIGDDAWIEAWVDEYDIGHIDLGSEATVTLHAFPR